MSSVQERRDGAAQRTTPQERSQDTNALSHSWFERGSTHALSCTLVPHLTHDAVLRCGKEKKEKKEKKDKKEKHREKTKKTRKKQEKRKKEQGEKMGETTGEKKQR